MRDRLARCCRGLAMMGLLGILAALPGCRRTTSADVGEQSIRDAQPIAIMQASGRATRALPGVVPETAEGGAVQQAPSRLGR